MEAENWLDNATKKKKYLCDVLRNAVTESSDIPVIKMVAIFDSADAIHNDDAVSKLKILRTAAMDVARQLPRESAVDDFQKQNRALCFTLYDHVRGLIACIAEGLRITEQWPCPYVCQRRMTFGGEVLVITKLAYLPHQVSLHGLEDTDWEGTVVLKCEDGSSFTYDVSVLRPNIGLFYWPEEWAQ